MKNKNSSVIRFPLRRLENNYQGSHYIAKRQSDLNTTSKSITSTENTRVTHSVPILNDLELFGFGIDIEVGSPPKKYLLLFDTGSSDTWIPSHNCTKAHGCQTSNGYNPAESLTYKSTNFPLNITYSIGSALGKYFTDRVSIGDFTVPKQLVAYIDSNKGPIATQNASNEFIMDGIFGAGYPAGSIIYQNFGKTFYPFPMSLWYSKLIPEPVFSISVEDSNKTDWSGEVVFGGVDLSKTSGKMVYTNVLPYNGTSVKDFMVSLKNSTGTKKASFINTQPFSIDTGSTFIYLPEVEAETLARYVDPNATLANGFYFVDCSYLTSSNVFSVYFPAEHDPASPASNKSMSINVSISDLIGTINNECVLLIVPWKYRIIGNIFLRKFVTSFDFGQNRIGFAPLRTHTSN
ncbi:aspartic peptidase domain-containing protein [Phycomyces blakesleeanus]